MSYTIYQVDAFSNQPFKGNPAAVCIIPPDTSENWMQKVAQEMNLSETAFLVRTQDGFNLRWFTPAAEVDLCGHATLASAHTLWEMGILEPDETAFFQTRSGLLTAQLQNNWIELDFPATPPQETEIPNGLEEAVGAHPVFVGKSRFDYLLELENEDVVRGLKPDFTAIGKLPVRGVIVTSRSTSNEFDFVSRFFAPSVGINEDPVTGSAHCCLAPYWSKKLEKLELSAYQASSRGGVLQLRLDGTRVKLFGQAVTVMKGELFPME
jgi:PhzF family phenazine biosynthesis protein